MLTILSQPASPGAFPTTLKMNNTSLLSSVTEDFHITSLKSWEKHFPGFGTFHRACGSCICSTKQKFSGLVAGFVYIRRVFKTP